MKKIFSFVEKLLELDFFIYQVLKKVPLKKLHNAKMVNLIGNQIEPYRQNLKLKL